MKSFSAANRLAVVFLNALTWMPADRRRLRQLDGHPLVRPGVVRSSPTSSCSTRSPRCRRAGTSPAGPASSLDADTTVAPDDGRGEVRCERQLQRALVWPGGHGDARELLDAEAGRLDRAGRSVPATIRAPKPPVDDVRTSGVTRASNSPTITFAFLTGAPVEEFTTLPTRVPLRAADAWSNAGCGSVSSPVALDAEAPAPRWAKTRPDRVGVVAVVAVGVGGEDRVAHVEERRVRRRQRHRVGDQPGSRPRSPAPGRTARPAACAAPTASRSRSRRPRAPRGRSGRSRRRRSWSGWRRTPSCGCRGPGCRSRTRRRPTSRTGPRGAGSSGRTSRPSPHPSSRTGASRATRRRRRSASTGRARTRARSREASKLPSEYGPSNASLIGSQRNMPLHDGTPSGSVSM